MKVSRATLVTLGLAGMAVALAIALLSRDEQPPAGDPSRTAKAARTPTARRALPDRSDGKLHEDEAEHSASPPPRRRFGERPAVEPEANNEEHKLLVAKIEAFHRWQVDARRQLMTCLPPPSLHVQPHEMRVVFEPLTDPPEGVPRQLVVARFEPGPGVDDPTTFAVPEEVQRCLDQLIGSPLELPEGSPELDEGHSESLHVPWG